MYIDYFDFLYIFYSFNSVVVVLLYLWKKNIKLKEERTFQVIFFVSFLHLPCVLAKIKLRNVVILENISCVVDVDVVQFVTYSHFSLIGLRERQIHISTIFFHVVFFFSFMFRVKLESRNNVKYKEKRDEKREKR